MRNGYDEPPLGLDTGQFYTIHVAALLSMTMSFVCASIVIGYSLRDRKSKSFFERTKSERFVVYMGICDATFNVIHAAEHIQMVVTRNHVHPIQICRLHALMSMELGFAQVFLVLFIAVNIFTLMFLHKNISFGKYDWKLLLTVVLCPFLIGVSSLLANIIGPNGA
ncbi:uncharacterized protein [Argopecten irradians]|uniref:uncharacterized protein n=1 Tax=Argopecten irradians TaxID=31199 RepID=UPI00371F6D4C